jgi:hypothetical protein
MVGVNMSQSFRDVLRLFDEQNFAICCNRLRVCLARGLTEEAKFALQEFIEFLDQGGVQVNMSDPVCDLFEVEIANLLEAAGYDTLESVELATDEELLRIPRFSDSRLYQVRQQLLRLRVMGGFVDSPVPTMIAKKAAEGKITELEAVVSTLTSAQSKAIAQVDYEISLLLDRLKELQKTRQVLAHMHTIAEKAETESKELVGQVTESLGDAAGRHVLGLIVDFLKVMGSQRPKAIQAHLESNAVKMPFHQMMMLIDSCPSLRRSTKGFIMLAQKEDR